MKIRIAVTLVVLALLHKYDCISAISELEATKRFFGHSCLQSRMQGTKKNKARKGHRAWRNQ